MLKNLVIEEISDNKEKIKDTIVEYKYIILTYLSVILGFYIVGVSVFLHKFNLDINEFMDQNMITLILSFLIFSYIIGSIVYLFMSTAKKGVVNYLTEIGLNNKVSNSSNIKKITDRKEFPFRVIYGKKYIKNSFLSLISIPFTICLFASLIFERIESLLIVAVFNILFIFLLFKVKHYMASINGLFIPLLSYGSLHLADYVLPGSSHSLFSITIASLGGFLFSHFMSGCLIKNSHNVDKQVLLTVWYIIAPLIFISGPTLAISIFILNSGFYNTVEVLKRNTNELVDEGSLVLKTGKNIFIKDLEFDEQRVYESDKYHVYRIQKEK